MSYCLAYVTTPSREIALSLAESVVGSKLAACGNVFNEITSVYWWQGKLSRDNECLLVLKTTDELKSRLLELIKKEHPYECPCVVFLPIDGGNTDFLKWIDQSLMGSG